MAASMPPTVPKTMKAILHRDPESDHLALEEIPVILPSQPGHVLLKVHATSPCAGELTWTRNYRALVPEDKIPVVCQDVSGQVVTAPAGSGFSPGDEVYARIDFKRPGAAAEYTVADAAELALKPRSLDFLEAAATPLSALTAWQALFLHGQLDPKGIRGDVAARERNARLRVLVTGASGGVGGFAVQLASLAGAGSVVAVCGTDKIDFVRGLGATEVVDYRTTSVKAWAEADAARECDLVVDLVGGETLVGCWAAVKAGGVLLALNSDPNGAKPAGLQKEPAKSTWFLVQPLGSNLAEITQLIDAGKLRPTIDSVWEFDDYAKAFERLDGGHAKGKVIIKVDGQI